MSTGPGSFTSGEPGLQYHEWQVRSLADRGALGPGVGCRWRRTWRANDRSWKRRWRLREQEWARKLGRLHLGVEPIEEQLARYRRATWGLTVVPGLIALVFLTLFTVFGRPDIGLIVVVILFVPIIVFSWLDYLRLERRARAYLAGASKLRRATNDRRERSTVAAETTHDPVIGAAPSTRP